MISVPALAVLGVGVVTSDPIAQLPAVFLGTASLVIAGVIRDRGTELQKELWKSWGGPPTTQRLRWRGASDREAVRRLHARLEQLDGRALPDARNEAADAEAADRRYEEAIATLRERCRKRDEFPLVFEENAEYGFRRNSRSLRWLGLAVAGVCAAFALALTIVSVAEANGEVLRWGIAFVVGFACAVYWWKAVNDAWVRRAAERYADRLFEALSRIARDIPTGR